MTETIPTYTSVMDDWMIEQREQEKKDAEVLEDVKNSTSIAYFKHIESELEESEHPSDYRIIDAPVGEPQYDDTLYMTAILNKRLFPSLSKYEKLQLFLKFFLVLHKSQDYE